MNVLDDLSGQEFGIWKVLAFDHMQQNGKDGTHGMSYYQCECQKCGAIRLKARSELTQCKNIRHLGCKVNNHARAI